MWFKSYDGGSALLGRINSAQIMALAPSGASSNWGANATLVDGSTIKVLPETYASKAAAQTAIDDLLLNGS